MGSVDHLPLHLRSLIRIVFWTHILRKIFHSYVFFVRYTDPYVVREECELRHCSVMSEKYIDLEVYKSKDASNFTDSIVYICVSWMICCHM